MEGSKSTEELEPNIKRAIKFLTTIPAKSICCVVTIIQKLES